MPVQKLTRQQKRELLWKHEAGQSPSDCAAEYGITRQYVHKLINLGKGVGIHRFDPCWTCGNENIPEGEFFCCLECEIKYDECFARFKQDGDIRHAAGLYRTKLKQQKADIQKDIS